MNFYDKLGFNIIIAGVYNVIVLYRIIDTMSAVNVIIYFFILNGRTCNNISTFVNIMH